MFAKLVKRLEGLPSSLKLRRYKRGERICQQAEAGWTAFYVLTDAEVAAFFQKRLQLLPTAAASLGQELAAWHAHVAATSRRQA